MKAITKAVAIDKNGKYLFIGYTRNEIKECLSDETAFKEYLDRIGNNKKLS